MESEDVYEALSTGLMKLQTDSYLNVRRISLLDTQRPKLEKTLAETHEAVQGLSTTVASQLTALTSKVDLLVKNRNQNALERKVEELLGQLVSLAQRS